MPPRLHLFHNTEIGIKGLHYGLGNLPIPIL